MTPTSPAEIGYEIHGAPPILVLIVEVHGAHWREDRLLPKKQYLTSRHYGHSGG